jgi:hypothetical protein
MLSGAPAQPHAPGGSAGMFEWQIFPRRRKLQKSFL